MRASFNRVQGRSSQGRRISDSQARYLDKEASRQDKTYIVVMPELLAICGN